MRFTAITLLLALGWHASCARGALPAARPAISAVPLIVGIFDISTAPALDDPNAPAATHVKAASRRAAGYPAAPELSAVPIERLWPYNATARARPYKAAGLEAAAAATSAAAAFDGDRAVALLDEQLLLSSSGAKADVRRPQPQLRRRAGGARAGFAAPAPPAAAAAAAAAGGGAPAAFAAGGERAVHVTGGVLYAYALDPATGTKAAALSQVRLQDLFAPVGSSNCRDGVSDPHAAFDPRARRFYLAAACGGTGSALLAVSATPEPAGFWYLYNLNADGIGTPLACPDGEAAVADYPRLNFNADALAVTMRTYCPSSGGAPGSPGAGAVALVLPKGAAASGETRVAFATFTSAEVAAAATSGGQAVSVAPAGVVQLEPAVPQAASDVTTGHMYFVADLATSRGAPRRSFLLVSLLNTAAMWGYNGTAAGPDSITPFIAAAVADRGAPAAPAARTRRVAQPEGSPELQATGLPSGIWSGRAALSGGKVYTVEEVAGADAGRTPELVWTVTQPSLSLSLSPAPGASAACVAPSGWGAGFDYSLNRSADFGASTQPAWEAFVRDAALASGLFDRARYYWGSRRPRPAAAYDAAEGKALDADLAAAVASHPDLAAHMNRSDVSPFMIPSADVPRPEDAAAASGVRASGKGFTTVPCAKGNKRCTFYGNVYGHSGYSRWNCWTCGYGTNGFYVKSKYYTGYQAYNWGYTGLGRVWYAGGWGSGGWGGGYFGGSGQSYLWGASTLNRYNAVGGTGGMGAWWSGGWGGSWASGPGWVAWSDGPNRRRALLQEGGGVQAAAAAATAVAPAVTAGRPPLDDDTVVAAVLGAQTRAGKAAPPVCVAARPVCAAAAEAQCPRGFEPRVTLLPRLLRHGSVGLPSSVPGAAPAALMAPALAVGRNGTMLVVATYSGAGKFRGLPTLAYAGLASITIPANCNAGSLRIEQRGMQALSQEAVAAAGVWPVPPAVAVHAAAEAAYVTSEKLPGTTGPAWVSVVAPLV